MDPAAISPRRAELEAKIIAVRREIEAFKEENIRLRAKADESTRYATLVDEHYKTIIDLRLEVASLKERTRRDYDTLERHMISVNNELAYWRLVFTNITVDPVARAVQQTLAQASVAPGEKVDETGLDPDEIGCVMQQTECTRAQAASTLRARSNIVDAILDLTN